MLRPLLHSGRICRRTVHPTGARVPPGFSALLPLVALLALAPGAGSLAAVPPGDGEECGHDLSTFEGRAAHVLERVAGHGASEGFWGGGKYGAYPAMAQFAAGDVERGRRFAAEQLEGGGAMFREFGNMAVFMRFRELYSPELRAKVKENQLHRSVLYAPGERGDLPGASENHKLMYAAANYLGGIAWPDDYPERWFRAGRDYLRYWFGEVTRVGFWEQDSPTYLVHHLGPVLSVLDHAPEGSEMAQQARMAYEWYLASLAGEYLRGYWITSSARDYVPVHGLRLSEESAAAAWLYFGGIGGRVPHPAPSGGHPPFIHWLCAVHCATAEYRPPAIFRRIANDRDSPYEHRELMWRNPMRPLEYAWIRPRYGLASIVGEGDRIPHDMTRWKLQWVPAALEDEPCAFFLKHPDPDHGGWQAWRGASPHESVIQHRGALLALYAIPRDDPHGFIDGPVHEAAYRLIEEKDGMWLLHAGSVLVALRAARGLEWAGESRPAYRHYGTTAEVRVLRSEGRRNAVAVQTAPVAEFGGGGARAELERFAEALDQRTAWDLSGLEDDPPRVTYTSLSGAVLGVEHEGERSVDGQPLPLDDWPLLENPWMHQDLRGDRLTLTHGGTTRIYDFETWKVLEEAGDD